MYTATEGWAATLLQEDASSGVPVTVEELVSRYGALLFRVAYAVLRNRGEAEDVVQDAFVRVLRHQSRLPDLREPRVWLVRIAWNLATDRRRRVQPGQMDEAFVQSLVATEQTADRAMEDRGRLQAVLAAVEALPTKEKQALLLNAVEELSTTEVAAVLGKSESAIRALLFRARQRLRTRLQSQGYEGSSR